jgi:ssDNA thymidine ADP-ribosyltransferase DarT-like protein
MSPPARPKIYHITHGGNLAGIIADGCLWSDAEIIARGGPDAPIGMSKIKKRRLEELDVPCHPGTKVGQFVPFNLCPRSVMLHILHWANHPELSYRGGQRPILHLEADLYEVVAWADGQGQPWAFTDKNAGSYYFQSFRDVAQLDRLNWAHIANNDFREPEVKDAKQAEILVFGSFPWSLVRRIGVISEGHAERVREIVACSSHRPDVVVQNAWYF